MGKKACWMVLGLLLVPQVAAAGSGGVMQSGQDVFGSGVEERRTSVPEATVVVAEEGVEMHDGFFLSLDVGGGFQASFVKERDGSITSLYGPSGVLNIAIGGAVAENFILSAQMYGGFTEAPKLCNGGDCNNLDNVQMNTFGLGAGIAYYFMPANFHISLAAGVGSMNAEGPGGTYEAEVGFSGNLALGKEWWVSNNWALGVTLQAYYMRPSDKALGTAWNVVGGGLMFSATYN